MTNEKRNGTNPTIEVLKQVKFDEDLFKLGFNAIGSVDDVYPNLTEAYRIWIWENENGYRIATYDFGNTHIKYACEGTKEAIKALEEQNWKEA